MAAVEMDVFTKLEGRQVTGQELQQVMGMDSRPTQVLASALVSTGLLEPNGGKNYSFAEIAEMLKKAGFKNMEKRPLAGPAQIAIGYKQLLCKSLEPAPHLAVL